jgi:hypothetical protein
MFGAIYFCLLPSGSIEEDTLHKIGRKAQPAEEAEDLQNAGGRDFHQGPVKKTVRPVKET